MNRYLLRWLLQLVNRKNAPTVIPIGGDEKKIMSRDYFSLEFTDSSLKSIFKSLSGDVATVLVADRETEDYEYLASVKVENLIDACFRCTFYYQLHEFKYSSAWKMFLHYNLGLWWLAARWDGFAQILFNRRSLPVIQRHELMQYIAEQWLRDRRYQPSPFTRYYGQGKRLWRHPASLAALSRERCLLDSMVATGDLSRNQNHDYTVNPIILASLAQLDKEERRIKSANRIQIWLLIVAAIAALGTCAQAFPSVPRQLHSWVLLLFAHHG